MAEAKRYSEENKKQLVEEFLRVGGSKIQFCKDKNISVQTFTKFLNKLNPISTIEEVVVDKRSSFTRTLNSELKSVQNQKAEIEELLNGKLKKQLEELTAKEQSLLSVIQFYQKSS